MDPLSSPDLLFPMSTRSSPMFYVTPSDVKLLMRPNEKSPNADALMAAWEALIALFFAMAQIMRLCTDYEQINKSPFASYHQHALVSPDTLSLIPPDRLQDREDDYNPPRTIHGLFSSHQEAQTVAEEWGACSVGKLAFMRKMTYHCEYSTAFTDERLLRLKKLDKTTRGLASTVKLSTPTMGTIADWGVEPQDLGNGIVLNQQVVMPFFLAYQEVRKSVRSRSSMGPVETLRYGLPKDSSDWNDVIFVSEKQVIEELAVNTLSTRIGTKLIANVTQLMSRAFGKKKPEAATPERRPSAVKHELRSPGAPGQEFDGEYQGYVPEGKFISAMSYVRSYVQGFAERLRALWKGVINRVHQPFIPMKSPVIFRWHPNTAWNTREWITKRMNMLQKGLFWEDEELMEKVRGIADPHIEKRKRNNAKAKALQDELSTSSMKR